jgi:hypothetical protein
MELTCRFDLRKGVFFIQPGFEYIIRPGGRPLPVYPRRDRTGGSE